MPTDDLGFDQKCIAKKAPTPVGTMVNGSWWGNAIDYDYVKSIGGVKGCFNPKTRSNTLDIGAYANGSVAHAPACIPAPPPPMGGMGGMGSGGTSTAAGGSAGGAVSAGGMGNAAAGSPGVGGTNSAAGMSSSAGGTTSAGRTWRGRHHERRRERWYDGHGHGRHARERWHRERRRRRVERRHATERRW